MWQFHALYKMGQANVEIVADSIVRRCAFEGTMNRHAAESGCHLWTLEHLLQRYLRRAGFLQEMKPT